MTINTNTAKSMVDVRIILSALWAARMLSSLQGDTVRLIDPIILNEMIAGTTDVPVTSELILIMSAVMVIPIFMSFLSLILPDKANRLANLIVGTFFVLWEIVFCSSSTLAPQSMRSFGDLPTLCLLSSWFGMRGDGRKRATLRLQRNEC